MRLDIEYHCASWNKYVNYAPYHVAVRKACQHIVLTLMRPSEEYQPLPQEIVFPHGLTQNSAATALDR